MHRKTQTESGGKSLGPIVLVAIGVNAMVGAGIYLIPGLVDQGLQGLSPLIYILAAVLLGTIALCFAQSSRLTDQSGGPYAYAKMAFPPTLAYLVGWICWITAIASCGAVSSALAIYLGFFVEGINHPRFASMVAAGIIVLLGGINILGVKWGGRVVTIFTLVKLFPLILLLIVGLPQTSAQAALSFPTTLTFEGFFKILMLAIFALQGFEVVPVVPSETRQPKTTISIAILSALFFSTVLYVLLQWVFSAGPSDLAGSERPLVDLATSLMPLGGATLIAAAGVLSIIGFVAGVTFGAPWYLVPLAQDRHVPSTFLYRHGKYNTPVFAIVLTTSMAAALALGFTLSELILLSSLGVIVQYGFSVASLMVVLAKKRSRTKRFVVPTLALLVTSILLSQVPFLEWMVFLALISLGLLLHLGHQRFKKSRTN